MKKLATILCAAVLATTLVACGGGAQSSTASTATSAAITSSESSFTGSWRTCTMVTDGITIWGDFSSMYGSDGGWTIDVMDNGTANMVMGDQSTTVNWSAKGNVITFTNGLGKGEDLVATLDGDVLSANMNMEDSDSSISFSRDGTTSDLPDVSPAGAQPITSADALVGTWKLTAAFSDTVNMYGPDGALAKRLGVSDTMVFNPKGKGSLMGFDFTWTTDAAGTSFESVMADAPVEVLAVDGGIIFSFGQGSTYLYSK